LSAIISGNLDGRKLRRVIAAAQKVEIRPRYEINPQGRLVSTYRYIREDPAAAIAYETLLIADEGRVFRRDLKQCRPKGCGRLFFWPDSSASTGRGRTRFGAFMSEAGVLPKRAQDSLPAARE
jgi:hypothetical protein